MTANRFGRLSMPVLAASAIFAMANAPTAAQAGFLDQLFGNFAAPHAPSYGYEAAQPAPDQPIYASPYAAPAIRRAKKRVAIDTKPVRQKTTDLMHDATLRPGDAVMMKDGLHVYEGPEASKHQADEFVALRDDDLPKKERARLAALDTTNNPALRGAIGPDTISTGRSAAVATPIVAGYRITDARGKSVRYVGP